MRSGKALAQRRNGVSPGEVVNSCAAYTRKKITSNDVGKAPRVWPVLPRVASLYLCVPAPGSGSSGVFKKTAGKLSCTLD